MKPSLQSTIFAGIAGTIAMTIIMLLAPMMGLPRMNAAEMLSSMMGFPVALGWIAHFMIGILFALSYGYFFFGLARTRNRVIEGASFGVAVFVFAQIMMALMRVMRGGMPQPEGGMALMMLGSLVGHIMYGIPVALIAKPNNT